MPPAPKPLVKPQKACVLCRRSKVKCIHEGGPPCKRCQDTKSECKFRLRADDEDWRERTDDTIHRLEGNVDFLMQHHHQREGSSSGATPGLPGPSHSRMDAFHASTSSPRSPRGIGKQSPFFEGPASNAYHPYPPPQQRGQGTPGSTASLVSPRYPSNGERSNSFVGQPDRNIGGNGVQSSATRYLDFDGASGLLSQKEAPMRGLQGQPRVTGPSSSSIRPGPDGQGQLSNSEADQTRPSGIIALAQEPVNYGADLRQTPAEQYLSIAATSPYARPSRYIGREDPRLTVISMGLVDMEIARHLFMFFARHLQPHSFGFPSYPAGESMTPLIIASILMVSAMHEPSTRHLHDRFRHEAFAALNVDQEICRDSALDPELGIGVEEITGACLAACWLGGRTAFKIARIARWWAVAYLKHFEVRSAQTLGEWMTILPPFRQIDLVEKLRIWLMSYIAEAQQAVMQDVPSLIPDSNPAQYCEGLLNSPKSHDQKGGGGGGVSGSAPTHGGSMAIGSASGPSQALASDRQLVAHARMMSIILAGQEIQRNAKRKIALAKANSPQGLAGRDAVIYEARQLVERWREWLEELNRWRLVTAQHEDLSRPTETSIDLSLLYHLSRSFLASLPLDPELGILDETHLALKHSSNLNDTRLAIAQLRTISTAKHSAVFALRLATRTGTHGFGDRLGYLPNFYHFLLGHAAGLLLTLVKRRSTFLMAKEDEGLLETAEKFIEKYATVIMSHSIFSTGAAKSAAAAAAAAKGEDIVVDMDGAGLHHPRSASHTASAAAATSTAAPPSGPGIPTDNTTTDTQSTGDRHPALSNAQELSRALYHVKVAKSLEEAF
ncbi:uncharacterized protein PFL1_02776 [Pseudozyma flocculosa PF-1]|uniref:Zn(2)-C6 fungal-type domain-containing protein n=1 Tax=Pseudozyma flocculosa PF-1 TaxID=1277687 RepID=A0A061H9L3_9BASI|nr:uncharacterized protein PFL1_02776 [Pseudozyma flocculosa PF-1]EPQ29557.1 hypothetical protein PFL1_02776 [Pseudozyma flocculosa PF-1]